MKTIRRRVAFVLFLTPIFLAPELMFAQSPFDGAWRTNMDQSKISPKPIVFSVKSGMYDRPVALRRSTSRLMDSTVRHRPAL